MLKTFRIRSRNFGLSGETPSDNISGMSPSVRICPTVATRSPEKTTSTRVSGIHTSLGFTQSPMKANYPLLTVISLAIAISVPSARSAAPEWPDALMEAQIKALTTGVLTNLEPNPEDSEVILIAKNWTMIAARQISSAKVTVTEQSGMMTSEFIFNGAKRFVAEGSPKEKRTAAERNLKKFIDAEIAIATKDPERPKIGETTFMAAKSSICPLWPFCD
jgi:hypothetical protein